MDSAPDFGSGGWGFESLRACQDTHSEPIRIWMGTASPGRLAAILIPTTSDRSAHPAVHSNSPPSQARTVVLAPPHVEQVVVELVNQERAAAGLPVLGVAPAVHEVARLPAEDMAAEDTLSHFNGDGIGAERLLDERRVSPRLVGENIGRTTESTAYAAEQVMQFLHAAFMGSAKHRANVLEGRFGQVGVGVASVDGRYYVAVVFIG
jgi:uncharacterized protein YkwD